MAAAAGARRLVLTHYAEDATGRDLDEAARAIYSGAITVADDHARIEL
jgi:ribonuclease BN (tRNA processing enzyme)